VSIVAGCLLANGEENLMTIKKPAIFGDQRELSVSEQIVNETHVSKSVVSHLNWTQETII